MSDEAKDVDWYTHFKAPRFAKGAGGAEGDGDAAADPEHAEAVAGVIDFFAPVAEG